MSRGLSNFVGYTFSKIGSCSYCTMRAFQFSVVSVVVTVLLYLFVTNKDFALLAALCSIGLTALWIAHVVTFSSRVHEARKDNGEFSDSRRNALISIAKIAAATALASASAGVAFADNTPCPVWTCPTGTICCKKDCGGGKTGNHCCTYSDCVAKKCIVPC